MPLQPARLPSLMYLSTFTVATFLSSTPHSLNPLTLVTIAKIPVSETVKYDQFAIAAMKVTQVLAFVVGLLGKFPSLLYCFAMRLY